MMLGFTDLFEKLRAGDETVEIEAKRGEAIGPAILHTVSAFSNEPGRGGGYLLLGVETVKDRSDETTYRIAGIAEPDRLQTDLATQCRTALSSTVRPQIVTHIERGKAVLLVYVPEATAQEKPIYIRKQGLPKGAYRRIGSTTQHCTEDDIALFYQMHTHKTFDETPVEDTALADVDPAALEEYRRARAEVNPAAGELKYADADLLHALDATARIGDAVRLTIAGLMLFGKEATLRRHFPMTRVDYIRVEGREWVPNPERRYQAVEMRGPLLTLIPRVIAQVLSEVPMAFTLAGNEVHRRDVPLIPRTVIREAVVNALMHRSYRLRSPVQIIRFSNRIEIRNPGHSLVPDDRLGEPGSVSRNEKIAAALHEAGLAETKGTGIRAMIDAMIGANLTLPTFESDREADSFTVRLLVLHLLGPEDHAWLARFKGCNLAEDEARALVWVREVGRIDNLAYRTISQTDTLKASAKLRRLRDLGLLEQKEKGVATYYVPAAALLSGEPIPPGGLPGGESPQDKALPTGVPPSDKGLSEGFPGLPKGFPPIPPDLADEVEQVGQRSSPKEIRAVIGRLCAWRALKPAEIGAILHRNSDYVRNNYLTPMIRDGELAYMHPENPAHPEQAYVAVQPDLLRTDEKEPERGA